MTDAPRLTLRILSLEDDAEFIRLVRATLEESGMSCELTPVETRDEFVGALREARFDLILADYSLPSFDGISAMHICRQDHPDLPFIFVSGSIGEELAIESLKNGATDYVLKEHLARLVPSIHRALREAVHFREKMKAEARVREQARMLDLAGDAIFVRDLDENILYWNRGAERLFGWTAAEAVDAPSKEFINLDLQAVGEAERELLDRGEWQGELRQMTKSGAELITSNRWTLVRDKAGNPKSILAIATDITERRRAEQREHWRNRILESLTSGASLPAILNLIVKSVEMEDSQALCSVGLLDESGSYLLHGAAPSLPDFFNRAIDGVRIGDGKGTCGTAAFTGQRVITEDICTDPRWENFHPLAERAGLRSCWSEPIQASNGRVLGVFAIYHRNPGGPDAEKVLLVKYAANLASVAIERMRAAEALRASEARYRTLFESAQDAIFMMRGERFLNCNPHTLEMFGCRLEQIVGETPVRFSPRSQPDGSDSAAKAREKIAASFSGVPQRFEWRHCRLDGSEFEAEVSLNRVDLDDEPLVLAVVRDITKRKQAEQRLLQSREQLRSLSARLQSLREEERTQIAREIHDHLGQLLTALKLDLRSIERKVATLSEPAVRAALETKITSARELTDETITSVQKIASELRPAILDRLGLEAAVEVETQAFQVRTGIHCEWSLPGSPLRLAAHQATAVFRIFQEILTNIARHAHATRVTVHLKLEDGAMVLVVTDDGVGIKTSNLESPKSMGLLGMQERAEILGGRISFEKHSGTGTEVLVRIPLDRKS